MKRLALVASIALIALTSCEKEPPPPPAPPPPPPKTADQLYNQAMQSIRPLLLACVPETEPLLRQTVSAELGKLKAEINGEGARTKITNDIKEALKGVYNAEQWQCVMNLCGALDAAEPDNTRTKRYRERAVAEINRPQIKVTGIYKSEDDGITHAFVDVFLPETQEMHKLQVRIGEEFLGLIFERIEGNNQKLWFKYLKTNQSFAVDGPKGVA